jgi:hypothetical protein
MAAHVTACYSRLHTHIHQQGVSWASAAPGKMLSKSPCRIYAVMKARDADMHAVHILAIHMQAWTSCQSVADKQDQEGRKAGMCVCVCVHKLTHAAHTEAGQGPKATYLNRRDTWGANPAAHLVGQMQRATHGWVSSVPVPWVHEHVGRWHHTTTS